MFVAQLLYRLGRFSARRAWTVILVWAVLLGGAGAAFALSGGALSDKITIPGTPTEQVQERLQDILGGGDEGSGTIVVQAEGADAITPSQQSALSDVIARADDVEGVDTVIDPFTTASDREMQAQELRDGQAQLDTARGQLDAGQAQLDAATAQAQTAGIYESAKPQFDAQQAVLAENRAALEAEQTKLTQGQQLLEMAADYRTVSDDGSTAIVTVTFSTPQADVTSDTKTDLQAVFDDAAIEGIAVDYSTEIATAGFHGGSAEVIGLIIAAIILIIMLGTLIAAGLPLISALVGVGVSVLGVLAFSSVVDMNATTPILGLMLGLAVGIDYTLFIVNRHREQLKEGLGVHDSIALATGTSGTAVVFAGATVIIALLALNVTGIPFLGLMGTAGAAAIASAVLVAVTLTPAMLSLAGRRVVSKKQWQKIALNGQKATTDKPMSNGRAVVTVIAATVALGVIALPALDMRLGLPDASTDASDSTTYRAYNAISDKFGAGQNGPLIVVADLPEGVSDDEIPAQQVSIGAELMNLTDVAAVVPVTTSDDNRITLFQVVPEGGPNDVATQTLVHDIRDLTLQNADVTFSVAGTASANIDISEKIGSALPPYLVIVIVLSILIMIAVFRSLLVPLMATAGFVLSLFASLGGVTAIYQFGWLGAVTGVENTGPVLSFLPIMLVGILFGLAMDYQLFIASGIREAYVHGSSARSAVTKGLRHGKTVVTAAALIMAGVFGGFMFGDSSVVKPLGFGLAFGVLIDAFVVRMLLLPAIMHLIGDAAWWLPKWLDKMLPNVDVEGATLQRPKAEITYEEIDDLTDTGSLATTR